MPEGPPWYETFFGQDYLDVFADELTPERADAEAAFVERVLGLKPGDEALDLCCGHGRHTLPLARRGLSMTGLDLSAPYLALLGARAAASGLQVERVYADMREIPFVCRFDAVINMFSSFGYFDSDAEEARVLKSVATALKPGGRLLLDLLNRDGVLASDVRDHWSYQADGTIVHSHQDIDLVLNRNRVAFTAFLPGGGRRDIPGHDFRLYGLDEIRAMLEGARLVYERVYGDYDGSAHGPDTWRTIVVGRKPG